MFYNWIPTQIILGFTWINCFYTIFSKLILISLTIIVFWISKNKLKNSIFLNCIIEFPLIISFSLLFMFLLTSSYDFFGVYLTIEGLSLTLYILGSVTYQSIVSIEGVLKYFSLGAISSGILLFGISIIFGVIGSLDFLAVQLFLSNSQILLHYLEIKFSILFLCIGFFFKISAFPFHIWIADVYEGIWTPITAFFAIVIKVCLVLFFLRLSFNVMFNIIFSFQSVFSFSAIGSICFGAFGALKQIRIKRFIAYTSINQIGFILLGIASCNFIGLVSSIIYIILYSLMSIIFFTLLLNTEHLINKRSMIYLSDLYSLSLYNNANSKYLILTTLSMAGLPPLGGFFGKLFLYFSIIEARLDSLLMVSLFISVMSTYYYLSFVRYIIFEKLYNYKLYYFIKKNKFNIILNFFSFFLISFCVYLPYIFSIVTSLALSCMWPLIWY
jgi:NADH-quinone oxidoreductase subunit N